MDDNHPRDTETLDGPAYKYPHNYGGYVKQQYLPDEVATDVYYIPSGNGKDVGRYVNENEIKQKGK